MEIKLELKNVSKSIEGKCIHNNISFEFKKGCYLITGPNGIGKTVLLDMIAGVQLQDEGDVIFSNSVSNYHVDYKKYLAYVSSKSLFFPQATGSEFLKFILNVKKANMSSLLNKFIEDIDVSLDVPFSQLSLGTQKKLFLATILIGENALVVLDEPSNGLDKKSHSILCEVLMKMSQESILIIATHDRDLINKFPATVIELSSVPLHPWIIKNDILG